MYTPKKLYTIIKINAVFVSLYFALRMMYCFYSQYHTTLLIVIGGGIICGIFGWLCSKNIWLPRGMIFLSFMTVLITTDLLMLLILYLFPVMNTAIIRFLWISGLIALVGTLLLFLYGRINEKHVVKNTLVVKSPKIKKDLHLAVLSDIHFGTIQSPEILHDQIDRINMEGYDAVLLTGDIAEEKTSAESLQLLFEELSRIQCRDGIYFVHGNHDRQEKLKNGRLWSDETFNTLMAEAGIRCIDDEVVAFDGGIQLIGRKDYSFDDKKALPVMLAASKPDCFRVVMEHQPVDLEEMAAAGVELCLSAHYHGAQTWPNNLLYSLAGMKYNGKYQIGDMLLYVNAGFTGSQYKIRTHGHCEYIDLRLENGQ